MYKRKVYYTLGMSEVVSGCFKVIALTHRGMYLKICGRIYDLQQDTKQRVTVARIETY